MLVRGRHLDPRLFHDFMGNHARAWWAILSPALLRERAESGETSLGENFEWLALRMAELDNKAGISRDSTPTP